MARTDSLLSSEAPDVSHSFCRKEEPLGPFYGEEGQVAGWPFEPRGLVGLVKKYLCFAPTCHRLVIHNPFLGVYMGEDMCGVKVCLYLLSVSHRNKCAQRRGLKS